MDIREKIEELWEKLTADDGILEQFKDAPVQTVEKLLGIDLPDEKIREIVAAIKEAEARGSGVISLNGKMVDKPVVIRAQRVIELALVAGIITKEEVEAL